jgi:hypothetical protein
MSRQDSIAIFAAVALATVALAAEPADAGDRHRHRSGRQEIRRDWAEIHRDRADLRRDIREYHRDRHALRRAYRRDASPKEIERLRNEVRRERRDVFESRRELREDFAELRRDLDRYGHGHGRYGYRRGDNRDGWGWWNSDHRYGYWDNDRFGHRRERFWYD